MGTVTCFQCRGAGMRLDCVYGYGRCRFSPKTAVCNPACSFGTCDLCGGKGTISELVLPAPSNRVP